MAITDRTPSKVNLESHSDVAGAGTVSDVKGIDWDVNTNATGSQLLQMANSVTSIGQRLEVDSYKVTETFVLTPDEYEEG